MNLKSLLISYYILDINSDQDNILIAENNLKPQNPENLADSVVQSPAITVKSSDPDPTSILTRELQNITSINIDLDTISNAVNANNKYSNISIGILVLFVILTILLSLGTLYCEVKKRRELEFRLKKVEKEIKIFTMNVGELKYETIIGMECGEADISTENGTGQVEE
jgi:hypothetical protein